MSTDYDPFKRLFDVIISLLAAALLAPIFLVIAALVVITDGMPIFFRQTRVGQGGRTFGLWKFRTMVRNAASVGGYQTVAGDPRITSFGRILRKTSLDELPQIWNVLVGHMSLVGPRPDTPQQQSDYTQDDWQRRTSVRPGLTGLAQVVYKRRPTDMTRTELDLDYIARRSFGLDMQILCMTVGTVVRLKNR